MVCMNHPSRPLVHFRGRSEPVLETFIIRGRRYEVLERLSHRGAFRVFDRRANLGGNYRALYRIPAALLTKQRAEVLRRLGGPNRNRNFPQTIECTRQGEQWWLITEWIAGNRLSDFLQQVRARQVARPSVREAVRLTRGLAHGLHHYHRKTQLIHGDVSPANLLVSQGSKQLVLVDFGSAWPAERAATEESGDGITCPYAAPERLAKHALQDARSDLFSLGVVLYELLTLQIPFGNTGGQAGLPQFVHSLARTYQPPSQLMTDGERIPREALRQLDQLLARLLALHPDERFPNSSACLAAWDALWHELQSGHRLSGWQRAIADLLTRWLPRR